ncbi:MAG: asparagine synthase (glutamine-hydrolyzing) [Anaerolineae bacterium]|nr:asparagine synthase (glutamine-hydrolyzing) [Anaerolineae bacterium]
MCGIAGIYAFGEQAPLVSRELVETMRDTMTHRGPDDAGIFVSNDRRLGLAHRRLSIIDLSSAGHQPMSNEDETLWITYNGEIYNYADYVPELKSRGHRFKSQTDTEVLLHLYEEYGSEMVHCLRGMFAFAIWDSRRRELFLARDRIGVKPLYYSVQGGRFFFASEIKAILADPTIPRMVDEEAFYHYLSFLTTPAPQTLFASIRKLPGGTWLRVRADGHISQQRYWDVWEQTTPLTGVSEAEIGERLLAELRTAVKLRKVSDVPVGVFLSGGLDSSTNAALFSEGEMQPIKTFSIGYQGEYQSYQNELHYARQMAQEVNADYHERLLTQDDLLDFLPHMVYLQDEPIADPVCVPVYYVAKLARDNGVIVCQVGEGADELFWGYPTWKQMHRLQQYDHWPVPTLAKRLGLVGLQALGRQDWRAYELLRRGAEGLPIFWGGAEAFSEGQKQALLSPRLRQRFARYSSWEVLCPIRKRFEANAWEPSDLHWMTYLDLNLRLPELLLMRVDKMSMGVSLETRVPFLDHKFVELALSIPEAVKMRQGVLKYLLKKAVRGLIPDELIDRKKQGFGVPVYEWFFDRLGEQARQELNDFCDHTDFLDRAEVMRLIDRGRGPQVWYLLNFALWWKAYVG